MLYGKATSLEPACTAVLPDRQLVSVSAVLVVLLTAQGCIESKKNAAGTTLTLTDQSWADKESQGRLHAQLRQFTHRTGVRVEVLPAPEAAVEQLATWRRLLEGGASVPDVYAIDVIWPGILADELLDLRTYIPAQEISAHFPGVSGPDANERHLSPPSPCRLPNKPRP